MDFTDKMINLINNTHKKKDFIFLCVGTDRVIGDSIGPLIGTNISNYIKENDITNVKVIGGLGKNLTNYKFENNTNNDEIIIAVDSALSNSYKTGDKIVDRGCIKIKEATNRCEKIYSDISVKCVVGPNLNDGIENFIMLQNMSLEKIIGYANEVSNSIYNVISYYV